MRLDREQYWLLLRIHLDFSNFAVLEFVEVGEKASLHLSLPWPCLLL